MDHLKREGMYQQMIMEIKEMLKPYRDSNKEYYEETLNEIDQLLRTYFELAIR